MEYLGAATTPASLDSNSIVGTFNQSAGDFEAKRLPPVMLAQKYAALLTYKAKDDDAKAALTDAMFKALEKALRAVASPNGRLQSNEYISEVKPLFEVLAAPANAPFIPARAPEALADIAVALADRVGKLTKKDMKDANFNEEYIDYYRNGAVALGALVLEYAKTYQGMIDTKPKQTKLSVPNKLTT